MFRDIGIAEEERRAQEELERKIAEEEAEKARIAEEKRKAEEEKRREEEAKRLTEESVRYWMSLFRLQQLWLDIVLLNLLLLFYSLKREKELPRWSVTQERTMRHVRPISM